MKDVDQGYDVVFIENIRMTGDGEQTQLRDTTSDETVELYAEDMQRGDRFPLVDLVPVGDGTYYIADGWHRILAHRQLGRGVVDAIILPVVSGADPLETATRYALRANQKHGRQLTRGDQKKRARTALLMPAFQEMSLRELEREIGVGKSTIARVRTALVGEGLLPWRDTEEPMPEYVPLRYSHDHKLAHDPFHRDIGLKEEAFRFAAQLAAKAIDPGKWTFIHADDADGEHLIEHRGLIADQTLRFPLYDNAVKDGLPVHYEIVPEVPERAHRKLTDEERDRIEAMKAKREFFAARDRLLKHPDKKLRAAVKTLARYRETPNLWRDLEVFLLSGGPDEEHRSPDF
jgi:hypothetical protein